MNLNDLKSLTKPQVEILESDNWTVEQIAAAQVKELTVYKGIGTVSARKAIDEAGELVNTYGLAEADRLTLERYYQKAPPRKILEDWAAAGLPIQSVALSTARALATLKGIDEELALRIISEAQSEVNRQKLYESQTISAPLSPVVRGNSAFPVEWLSGEVEPPPMGVRVKRAFDQAKEIYEAEAGK